MDADNREDGRGGGEGGDTEMMSFEGPGNTDNEQPISANHQHPAEDVPDVAILPSVNTKKPDVGSESLPSKKDSSNDYNHDFTLVIRV